MFCTFDVNGAAIDASASDSDSPTSATLSALQSFAPSPHIPTFSPVSSCSSLTSSALWSGDILAYTLPPASTRLTIRRQHSNSDAHRRSGGSQQQRTDVSGAECVDKFVFGPHVDEALEGLAGDRDFGVCVHSER